MADPSWISQAVAFDWPRLGELRGFDGVHLRCHLGADTICLARLGARKTGLDLSPCSNEHARRIAAENKVPVDYVVSGVYQAVGVLGSGRFDPVYIGPGSGHCAGCRTSEGGRGPPGQETAAVDPPVSAGQPRRWNCPLLGTR